MMSDPSLRCRSWVEGIQRWRKDIILSQRQSFRSALGGFREIHRFFILRCYSVFTHTAESNSTNSTPMYWALIIICYVCNIRVDSTPLIIKYVCRLYTTCYIPFNWNSGLPWAPFCSWPVISDRGGALKI